MLLNIYDDKSRLTQTTKIQDTKVLGYVTKEVVGLGKFVVSNAVSAKVLDIYNSLKKTYDIVKVEIKDKIVAKAVITIISSSLVADNTKFN